MRTLSSVEASHAAVKKGVSLFIAWPETYTSRDNLGHFLQYAMGILHTRIRHNFFGKFSTVVISDPADFLYLDELEVNQAEDEQDDNGGAVSLRNKLRSQNQLRKAARLGSEKNANRGGRA